MRLGPGALWRWQNIARGTGLTIVVVELRQVLIGGPVDQGLLLVAAGLLGLAHVFKRNGNGGSGNGPASPG